MQAPSRPLAENPTEFTVDLSWQASPGATGYTVLRKCPGEEWDAAVVTEYGGSTCSVTVEDLQPTSTYIFKLIVNTASGASPPSDDTVIDTQVGSCAPKSNRCLCTVQ